MRCSNRKLLIVFEGSAQRERTISFNLLGVVYIIHTYINDPAECTVRDKILVGEKFGECSISNNWWIIYWRIWKCCIYIFSIFYLIGQENFGELNKIRQIGQNFVSCGSPVLMCMQEEL